MSIIYCEPYDKYKRAAYKQNKKLMKQVLSFSIIIIYILVWSFIGSMFFGPGGLKVFLIISLILIWVTFFLGDKFVLFLIGARELSLKNLKLESFINGLSCSYEIPPINLYKLSLERPGFCLIKSASPAYSLIMTEDLLKKETHREFIEKTISLMDYKRDTIIDLAIVLCYQMLLPGYLLGHFFSSLKSMYFYLLYPLILMKSYLSRIPDESDFRKLMPSSLAYYSDSKSSSLVRDVFSDYGIVYNGRGNLWGGFVE